MDITKRVPKGKMITAIYYRDSIKDDKMTTIAIRVGTPDKHYDGMYYDEFDWVTFDIPKVDGGYNPDRSERPMCHNVMEGYAESV